MPIALETLENPGEYGTQARPQGWTVIQLNLPSGNGRKIYLTSEGYYKAIAKQYNISEANIAHLNHKILAKDAKEHGLSETFSLSNGIPEQNLPGSTGLNFFKLKLQPIWNAQTDVLIHCAAGQNRTPVAAAIYLMHLGIEPNEAKELIQAAIKERDPDLRLNQKGQYDQVLKEAANRFEAKTLSNMFKKQSNPATQDLQQTSSTSFSETQQVNATAVISTSVNQASQTSTIAMAKKRAFSDVAKPELTEIPSKSIKPAQKKKAKQSVRSKEKESEEEVEIEEQLASKKKPPTKKLSSKASSKIKYKKSAKITIATNTKEKSKKLTAAVKLATEGEKFIARFDRLTAKNQKEQEKKRKAELAIAKNI